MKGYWIICVSSYEIDGNEVSRGKMEYYNSHRPILSKNWRRATDKEIEARKWHKGVWYNHDSFT